ncbi:fimbrial biogenesis outer membrane usher protein [Trinickia fusca]|uniref:Fimbrial biogenesis outer membrane usher protein n=2 Tax=Trinickia fusca TaxID=2419777 RepID=A0A494XUU3_9BURK|nr:fimbrial biogenesis outer membrane usher protein [Trinickia fusca]
MLGSTRVGAHSMLPITDINPNGPHDVVLEVDVNGQRTTLLVSFREHDGHLSAHGKDLNEIGFSTDRLGIADTADVQLDSIPGLHYTYDAANQTVDLDIPDGIRRAYTLESRSLPATPKATSARGLVINYDAFAQTLDDEQLSLYSEERYFDSAGVFSNTGIAYLYRNEQRYIRYDTSWRMSTPTTPSTTQIGDTITSSLAWTRSIRLGGFQWRSNFALRPDLVTFPVPALAGSAVLPSAVDLYINNVRQFSDNVPSGPFIVNEVPGITGAGEATVVTRDALGRTIATSVPLYVDTRMLAPGLTSYSFEAGFLRRDYGLESFEYDRRPAVSTSARRGLSDTITVEGHAEATPGLYNVGAGALVRLGMAGVINGALAASAGRLAGTQVSLGYQLIEPNFLIDAQTIRAFGNYGDLAARDGIPVPSATDRVTLALPFLRHKTFSVSYIAFRSPQGPSSRIGSVACTLDVGNRISLSLNAYRDFKQRNANGAFVAITFGFGDDTSVSATAGRHSGQSSYNVSAIRPPDYAGGSGWGVQAGGAGSVQYRQAQFQYLGNDGEATAIVQDVDRHAYGTVDLSGALVLMDGNAQLSRRIDDGFALVVTNGVAGIPVLHENRVIGTTDSSGHFLVPDLNSYQSNQISINSSNLPADAQIAATSANVVPQAQSGVLAHFGVTRYSAASIILHGPNGAVLPPGSRVHHVESGKDTITGYDGLTFIDELHPDNHLVIDSGTLHCSVQFGYVRPRDGTLPVIGPLTCRAAEGDTP